MFSRPFKTWPSLLLREQSKAIEPSRGTSRAREPCPSAAATIFAPWNISSTLGHAREPHLNLSRDVVMIEYCKSTATTHTFGRGNGLTSIRGGRNRARARSSWTVETVHSITWGRCVYWLAGQGKQDKSDLSLHAHNALIAVSWRHKLHFLKL